MSSNQGHEEQGPERSGKTDQSAAPLESADALRGGEPGGRQADGLDAAQRVEDESSLESELESPGLEDLARTPADQGAGDVRDLADTVTGRLGRES